jgi:probable rRNA maturation factor
VIEVFYRDTEILEVNPEFFVLWLSQVCKKEGKVLVELSIIFCSDDYLLEVNKEYLSHDYYTDIITFDYCEGDRVSGDLFVSIDRVRDNANAYNVEFKHELFRVVVHGLLHLLGYKDKSEEEKFKMRELEDGYLALVPRETF